MKRPSKTTLDRLNTLLPGASPAGAYAIGIVCAIAWSNDQEPGLSVLEAAAECPSTAEAVRWFEALEPEAVWKKSKIKR